MRQRLVDAAFALWRRGMKPGLPIEAYGEIDAAMDSLDAEWTPQERAELRRRIKEFVKR